MKIATLETIHDLLKKEAGNRKIEYEVANEKSDYEDQEKHEKRVQRSYKRYCEIQKVLEEFENAEF